MAGLTNTGFEKKTLAEILDDLNTAVQNTFGPSNTDSESVFGQYNGIIAEVASDVWELAELTYQSSYPLSAIGVSLDSVVELNNLKRLDATSSTVNSILEGDEGAAIPISTQFRQTGTNELFESLNAVVISDTNLIRLVISINDVNDVPHTLDITTEGITKNYISNATSDAVTILSELAAQIFIDGLQSTILDSINETLTITSIDLMTTFEGAHGTSIDFDELWSPIILSAVNTGPLSVPISSVTEIATPVVGLNAVDNLLEGAEGRDVETDDEFRIRRKQSISVVGAGTVPAIEARVTQEVPNVTSTTVKDNRTDLIDSGGRPPHSYETICTYPIPDAATEQLIANKIFEVGPAGIQTFGGITLPVTDSQGNIHTISFSRPSDILIEVDVDFDLDAESLVIPSADAIKKAIRDFATANQKVGDDILIQTYFEPIYSVAGVGVITKLEMNILAGPISTTILDISATEIADFGIAGDLNITITQNP